MESSAQNTVGSLDGVRAILERAVSSARLAVADADQRAQGVEEAVEQRRAAAARERLNEVSSARDQLAEAFARIDRELPAYANRLVEVSKTGWSA